MSIWVGFTGTRSDATHDQLKRVGEVLALFGGGVGLEDHQRSWFVHGGARGADLSAHKLAKLLRYFVRMRPATEGSASISATIDADEVFPPEPALQRNPKIVDDSHYMIACPFGFEEEQRSGTWATIRYARRIHKPLAIIWPDGDQQLEFWPGSKIPKGW